MVVAGRGVHCLALIASSWIVFASLVAAQDVAVIFSDDDLRCAVMPDEPADSRLVLQHDGVDYFFCCVRCMSRFAADPARWLPGSTVEGVDSQVKRAVPQSSLLARSHVVWVHFPIVLILLTLLLECLRSFHFRVNWEPFVSLVIFLAVLSVLLAAYTGWQLGEGMIVAGQQEQLLRWHRWTGVLICASMLVCAGTWWLRRNEDTEFIMTTLFRVALVASSVAVVVNAHLGGMMVHGPDYLR